MTVVSVSSVTSSALALEVLALQRETLGRGVTVVVPGVAGVDQLRPCWFNYRGGGRVKSHRGMLSAGRRDPATLQNVLR